MYRRDGTQWTWIHAAAARMYGSYGRLLVTDPANETLDAYDPASGTWSELGRP